MIIKRKCIIIYYTFVIISQYLKYINKIYLKNINANNLIKYKINIDNKYYREFINIINNNLKLV